MTARVESGSLVDLVVERIEKAILLGEYPAGMKLSEQSLATELGVSRSPMREAFRRLEGKKLVVRRHNAGARVAEHSAKELREVLEIREALESYAARKAAENMTVEEKEALLQLVERQREYERQGLTADRNQSPEQDFHLFVIRGSKNDRLSDMLYGDLYYALRVLRYRSSSHAGRNRLAIEEHAVVAAAIAAGQPEVAEQAMRVHLRRSHENMLQAERGKA